MNHVLWGLIWIRIVGKGHQWSLKSATCVGNKLSKYANGHCINRRMRIYSFGFRVL